MQPILTLCIAQGLSPTPHLVINRQLSNCWVWVQMCLRILDACGSCEIAQILSSSDSNRKTYASRTSPYVRTGWCSKSILLSRLTTSCILCKLLARWLRQHTLSFSLMQAVAAESSSSNLILIIPKSVEDAGLLGWSAALLVLAVTCKRNLDLGSMVDFSFVATSICYKPVQQWS